MAIWKLTLAYDGTPYHGWQVQPGLPTIQGTLADALRRITGETVLPQGSGRTDAGVHALGQVASFALASPIPAANLHRALNRRLPPSIRVLTAEIAPPHFHARHSALRKTYEYRIFPLRPTSNLRVPHDHLAASAANARLSWGYSLPSNPDPSPLDLDPICPPTLAPFVWPCPWPLSLEALNQAARHILGSHDFTTFAAVDPDQATRLSPSLVSPDLPAHPSADPTHPLLPQGTPRLQPWISPSSEKSGALAPGVCLPSASPTNVRTIHQSHWHTREDLVIYTVTGSGFLHHMVRNLVGAFVQAGAQRLAPDSIPNLLAARNRTVSGPTAPATGLFLLNVEYPEPAASHLAPCL